MVVPSPQRPRTDIVFTFPLLGWLRFLRCFVLVLVWFLVLCFGSWFFHCFQFWFGFLVSSFRCGSFVTFFLLCIFRLQRVVMVGTLLPFQQQTGSRTIVACCSSWRWFWRCCSTRGLYWTFKFNGCCLPGLFGLTPVPQHCAGAAYLSGPTTPRCVSDIWFGSGLAFVVRCWLNVVLTRFAGVARFVAA